MHCSYHCKKWCRVQINPALPQSNRNKLCWCLSITLTWQKKVLFCSFSYFLLYAFKPKEWHRLWIFLPSLYVVTPLCIFSSTLFSIRYTLSNAILSPRSCKLCIISYSGSLLTAVSKLKLSFCFPFCCLPTLFCHFCTLSCQLFISLYSRVLWFLFPLLCLPLQLELSNQIPLFLLLVCELLSVLGNLVFLWDFSQFVKCLVFDFLFLLEFSFDQHLCLPSY